jgi:hypothetical protein
MKGTVTMQSETQPIPALKPAGKRKSLAALLDATPDGLHRIDGWDALPKAGREL